MGNMLTKNYKFEHTLKVSGLHLTLISVPALDKSGCTITAANGQQSVYDNGQLVFMTLYQDETYVWDPDIAVATILNKCDLITWLIYGIAL